MYRQKVGGSTVTGQTLTDRGVGGKPKIVAKPDPSVSNSAWESIFQTRMNVGLHFTT